MSKSTLWDVFHHDDTSVPKCVIGFMILSNTVVKYIIIRICKSNA